MPLARMRNSFEWGRVSISALWHSLNLKFYSFFFFFAHDQRENNLEQANQIYYFSNILWKNEITQIIDIIYGKPGWLRVHHSRLQASSWAALEASQSTGFWVFFFPSILHPVGISVPKWFPGTRQHDKAQDLKGGLAIPDSSHSFTA